VLAVQPPVAPMLARPQGDLPEGDHWLFEPKWDGFRCIVFRDGNSVELHSRNERPLTRYFPELAEPLRRSLPDRAVVDGEVVITGVDGLNFDALLQRIHPADSRVRMLAASFPASFVAFDLLGLDDRDLRPLPFAERRRLLVETLAEAAPPVHLTPVTAERDVAADWFARFEGAGLDGVVAKDPSLPYRENERVMVKVKHARTADCVVGGWRRHAHGGVGSLLLGLFDTAGTLHRVGVCSGFSAARRRSLEEELAAHTLAPGGPHPWVWADGNAMVEPPNRWNQGKDTSWHPLTPDLVVEVAYDHLQGDRFRHATRFVRWRDDRDPSSCRYDQLDSPVPAELREIFSLPTS
jgi:ATP-dependent DNA ligase